LSQNTLHSPIPSLTPLDVEAAVRERYSAASQQRAADLCCPVSYDARYLEALPRELIERDYGCGDPSKHVRPGETVLDLGSGGGKICYIAAQVVGPQGRVIGVDCNDDMLALARKHQRPIVLELWQRRIVERERGLERGALPRHLRVLRVLAHAGTDRLEDLLDRQPRLRDRLHQVLRVEAVATCSIAGNRSRRSSISNERAHRAPHLAKTRITHRTV